MKYNPIEEQIKFYEYCKNLCKPNEYNLILHKHLGDLVYAVAAKDDFEKKYKAPLHFIVREQHVFLLKMYGITNYTIANFDKLIKENVVIKLDKFFNLEPTSKEIDWLENDTFLSMFSSLPIIGQPFICDSLYNKLFENKNYNESRFRRNLGLEQNKNNIPTNIPELKLETVKEIENISKLSNIVLIAPEAKFAEEFPAELWEILIKDLHKNGFTVFINSKSNKYKNTYSVYDFDLTLKDVIALAYKCAAVFSIRSGLCDVLVGLKEKLYVIYPANMIDQIGDINNLFNVNDSVNEIRIYDFKLSEMYFNGFNYSENINIFLRQFFMKCIKYKIISHIVPTKKKYFKYNNKFLKFCHAYSNAVQPFFMPILANHFINNFLQILALLVFAKYRKKWLKLMLYFAQIKNIQENNKNAYIFVLFNPWGDFFLACSLFEEFKKSHKDAEIVVLCNGKFRMDVVKMFPAVNKIINIKNDFYTYLMQHEPNQILTKGIIYEMNHWQFKQAPNIRPLDFGQLYAKMLDLPSTYKYSLPNIEEKVQEKVRKYFKNQNIDIKKIVMLFPHANSFNEKLLAKDFWEDIANYVKSIGYIPIINSKDINFKGIKSLFLSVPELIYLSQNVFVNICLRSGITDILAISNAPNIIVITPKDVYFNTISKGVQKREMQRAFYINTDKTFTENMLRITSLKEISKRDDISELIYDGNKMQLKNQIVQLIKEKM